MKQFILCIGLYLGLTISINFAEDRMVVRSTSAFAHSDFFVVTDAISSDRERTLHLDPEKFANVMVREVQSIQKVDNVSIMPHTPDPNTQEQVQYDQIAFTADIDGSVYDGIQCSVLIPNPVDVEFHDCHNDDEVFFVDEGIKVNVYEVGEPGDLAGDDTEIE